MNQIDTLKKTEFAIAELSKSEKAQLLKWLEQDVENVFPGIEKNPKIMGSAACIRKTRIPVWLLEQARRQNVGEVDLLRNYPGLTAQDLVNAWNYVSSHKAEIENHIAEAEDFISERGKRGSREKFLEFMAKVPDVEPEERDRLN